jgi:hypothetical protein
VIEVTTSVHLRSILVLAIACAACRQRATTDAPADHPTPEQKVPDVEPAPAADRPTVDVDLSPSGIGATIRGPEGAKAAAHEDYVVVDAEPDFHMEVHRGPVDLLAEKAEIVKKWGPAFRRFVRDDDEAVVYETELAGDNRFHFLSWGDKDGLLYHCRSDKKGAESVESVQRMLDGCHAITVHERVAGKP